MNKLQAMATGGLKLAQIRQEIINHIQPGTTLQKLDQLAEKLLFKTGGEPAFKKVPNYHWSTCININHGVVHGIPNLYQIKAGDIVSLDIGLYYHGYYTDTSITTPVGKIPKDIEKFLNVGENALKHAIAAACPNNHVGHISQSIQENIEKAGYSVVSELTGHGVGKKLHENPRIPCFLNEKIHHTPKLSVGQTLAIEVIYTMGKPNLITQSDGWTISTQDGKMSGLFEETVAITANGPLILTKQPTTDNKNTVRPRSR
jgi:methionyl aminopeptidase